MRNVLVVIGLGALVIIAGASYAFNHPFTKELNTEGVTNSSTTTTMANGMTLMSSVFAEGASIPSKYTCEGDQVNPPLSIAGVPANAKSLTLIMDDPDIPQVVKEKMHVDVFDHWVLFNIPATTTEIAMGMTVGTPGLNGAGKPMYTGPCPPKEYEPSEHRYFFKLYALDIELSLKEGASKADVEKAMQGHIVAETQLIGKYKKVK